MALVQLSDVIIPEVYDSYGFVPNRYTYAFLASPAVRRDPELDAMASAGGNVRLYPYWNDLDASADPNISSDDPTHLAIPQKINAGLLQVRSGDYNNAWSAADLASMLAGSNAMEVIKAHTGEYWSKQQEKFLAQIALGVAASNAANNANDMTNDISVATGTPGATNLFSHNAVIDAVMTDGEFFGDLAYMITPMTVYTNLLKQNSITFTTPASQTFQIPTYGGIPLLRVNDNLLSVSQGANNPRKYTTILCGAGAFAYGEGNPTAFIPSEIRREPLQGNGGGVEVLIERQRWAFGVTGHTFTNNSVALQSPTSAEWGASANWLRKYPRNNVRLAFLQSNG